jgi:hypothetical protein
MHNPKPPARASPFALDAYLFNKSNKKEVKEKMMMDLENEQNHKNHFSP